MSYEEIAKIQDGLVSMIFILDYISCCSYLLIASLYTAKVSGTCVQCMQAFIQPHFSFS